MGRKTENQKVDEVKGALQQFVLSPETANELRERAKRVMFKKFDWEEVRDNPIFFTDTSRPNRHDYLVKDLEMQYRLAANGLRGYIAILGRQSGFPNDVEIRPDFEKGVLMRTNP